MGGKRTRISTYQGRAVRNVEKEDGRKGVGAIINSGRGLRVLAAKLRWCWSVGEQAKAIVICTKERRKRKRKRLKGV